MEEQAQRSMEMLAHTATAPMLGRSSWDLLSMKAPAPTAMISLVKSTPKATAEQLCVVSASSAKGAAPGCFCFWGSVEKWSSPAASGQGTVSGCGVLPTKHKGFQQQRGSGVRSDPKIKKSTTDSPGKVLQGGILGEGTAEPWWPPQRPPASMTSPSFSPLDGAAGEA